MKSRMELLEKSRKELLQKPVFSVLLPESLILPEIPLGVPSGTTFRRILRCCSRNLSEFLRIYPVLSPKISVVKTKRNFRSCFWHFRRCYYRYRAFPRCCFGISCCDPSKVSPEYFLGISSRLLPEIPTGNCLSTPFRILLIVTELSRVFLEIPR